MTKFKDVRGQITDIARSQAERELLAECENIFMPFGKYSGTPLLDVPTKYLDEVISTMPPTWLVRKVWQVVDLTMQLPVRNFPPSNQTLREVAMEWLLLCQGDLTFSAAKDE